MARSATVSHRVLFLSWVSHSTRSASLAQALGAECEFVADGRRLGLLKYLPRAWRSWRLLAARRPALVICMNPPYFLPFVAWCYCRRARARFVLDSHTAAFDQRRWTWMRPLHAFLVRRAALSIVTNEALGERVAAMGGNAVIVQDIPYTLPAGRYPLPADAFTVVFICTYAADEPLAEVCAAARALPEVRFFVTGNSRKAAPGLVAAKPANLEFTGFLSRADYAGLLRGASAVLALTTRDFTMQRGGSEAVSAGKPLITSDWPVLRRIFPKGALHVDNRAASIASAIATLRADYGRYEREIAELATERQAIWLRAHATLTRLLPELQKG
jgi:glycosyltransferase involved in cell wall biosynthesis